MFYIVSNGKPTEYDALGRMDMFKFFDLLKQYKNKPPQPLMF